MNKDPAGSEFWRPFWTLVKVIAVVGLIIFAIMYAVAYKLIKEDLQGNSFSEVVSQLNSLNNYKTDPHKPR
jgi:L-asparagine transporter-like permease